VAKAALIAACLLFHLRLAQAAPPEPLPGTAPLETDDDLSASMLDGLHRFVDRLIEGSPDRRARHWRRDLSSAEAYQRSVTDNRNRFAQRIGVVDQRVPVVMERFGDDESPALVAETARYRVYQVRWPVLADDSGGEIFGEGLLVEPANRPVAGVVALPDADQTPEQIMGLAAGVEPAGQFARRLAESGCRVVIPVLVDRGDQFTGNPISGRLNPGYSHREWIYRQAYHMGRHVIGYEVQKVLAAIDWLKQRPGKLPAAARADGDHEQGDDKPGDAEQIELAIGVAGYGEGGLIAFYAAAIDNRIDAALVSGYFRSRQHLADEPLYRNVWALLDEFGDAEIASLIAPRGLVIEYSPEPDVTDRQTTTPPQIGGFPLDGIHGRLRTPTFEEVSQEFERLGSLVPERIQGRRLVSGQGGQPVVPGSPVALAAFFEFLAADKGVSRPPHSNGDPADGDTGLADRRGAFDPAPRQRRQVKALERHIQTAVNDSHLDREAFCQFDLSSLAAFEARAAQLRTYAWEELFGKLDTAGQNPQAPGGLPLNPRSRKVYDRPGWTGHEVVLDVLPDVFAWGVLLMPTDIKPGERRPVVVCQHGRNGLPRDVIEGDHPAYHDFAARLAERGFVVFAPHNPYRGEDRYRRLSRKANGVKASLFSFILAQHERILDWLESLPFVDSERIAFYGLSYGGETAVRVPPLLDRYCLSICSADFNDWARKVASTHSPHSFMFTIEWEMPYFNMGRTLSYAELAALMAPRAFMVERGHDDGVAPDEWVAHEYARVRRVYDRLGIGDRTAIEFFNGGHTIHAQGTFEFLQRQMD
jgi:dienelactone hydrolase